MASLRNKPPSKEFQLLVEPEVDPQQSAGFHLFARDRATEDPPEKLDFQLCDGRIRPQNVEKRTMMFPDPPAGFSIGLEDGHMPVVIADSRD